MSRSRFMVAIALVFAALPAIPAHARLPSGSVPSCTGRWELITPPLPAASEVFGVAASAANDVWIVGTDFTGRFQHSLAIRWDGSGWTTTLPRTSDVGRRADGLDILALDPADAWMVSEAGARTPLARWDGTSWTNSPFPHPARDFVVALDAAGPNEVWAVGGRLFARSGGRIEDTPLTMRWDGSSWSIVPNPIKQRGDLADVAVIGPNDVWAVGSLEGANTPLIEHWDGASWSVVPPARHPAHGELRSVDAFGPQDVWAVGGGPKGPFGSTLIEHWDGAAWTRVRQGEPQGELRDVEIGGAGDGWMLDTRSRGEPRATVLDRFRDGVWQSVRGPRGFLLGDLSSPRPGLVWGVGVAQEFGGPVAAVRCRPDQSSVGMPGSASG